MTNRQQRKVWQFLIFMPTLVVFFCRKHNKRLKDEIWIAASSKRAIWLRCKKDQICKNQNKHVMLWMIMMMMMIIKLYHIERHFPFFVLPWSGRMYFPGVPFRAREAFHQSWFSLLKALWQLRGDVLWWQFYVKGSGKIPIKCHCGCSQHCSIWV